MPRLLFEELIKQKYNRSVRDVLQELASNDHTQITAAKYLQCSPSTILIHSNKHGVVFKSIPQKDRSKAKAPKDTNQRDVKINQLLSAKWV
jgi:hypothetical protein